MDHWVKICASKDKTIWNKGHKPNLSSVIDRLLLRLFLKSVCSNSGPHASGHHDIFLLAQPPWRQDEPKVGQREREREREQQKSAPKNQNLISILSESDRSEIVVLIFFSTWSCLID